WQLVIVTFRPTLLYSDVVSVDETGLAQATTKGSHDVLERRRRRVAQQANDWRALLPRSPRERPCSRPAARPPVQIGPCSLEHAIPSGTRCTSLPNAQVARKIRAGTAVGAKWRPIARAMPAVRLTRKKVRLARQQYRR